MGYILLILGLLIGFYWTRDIKKGKSDPMHYRLIHGHPIGRLVPYIIAIILIISGIILLA